MVTGLDRLVLKQRHREVALFFVPLVGGVAHREKLSSHKALTSGALSMCGGKNYFLAARSKEAMISAFAASALSSRQL